MEFFVYVKFHSARRGGRRNGKELKEILSAVEFEVEKKKTWPVIVCITSCPFLGSFTIFKHDFIFFFGCFLFALCLWIKALLSYGQRASKRATQWVKDRKRRSPEDRKMIKKLPRQNDWRVSGSMGFHISLSHSLTHSLSQSVEYMEMDTGNHYRIFISLLVIVSSWRIFFSQMFIGGNPHKEPKLFMMCLFFKEASEREKKNFFMFMKNNKNLLCTKSYFPQWPYQQRGPLMMKKVLLIVLCVCTAHFLWRLFFRTEIWRIMMKKKKTTKLLSLSQRCNVDSPAPKKGKKEKTSAEVHRRSQIIRNIYVAQINSRWNESAEDICKILKCTFFYEAISCTVVAFALQFPFFSVRQSSN